MRSTIAGLIFLGILTLGCLLGGFLSGLTTANALRPTSTAESSGLPHDTTSPTPGLQLTPGPQKTVLLLVVDNANASSPVLLSACWIAYRAGAPTYHVVGIHPDTVIDAEVLDSPRPLRDIFAADQLLNDDNRILRQALESMTPAMPVEVDIVLDRADLVGIATSLGGVTMDGRLHTGMQLLEALDISAEASPADEMGFHERALRALLETMASQNRSASDFVDAIADIPRIGSDEARLDDLRIIAASAPRFSSSVMVWSTMLPEVGASAP